MQTPITNAHAKVVQLEQLKPKIRNNHYERTLRSSPIPSSSYPRGLSLLEAEEANLNCTFKMAGDSRGSKIEREID